MIPRSAILGEKRSSQMAKEDAGEDLQSNDDVLSLSASPSKQSDIPEPWIIED